MRSLLVSLLVLLLTSNIVYGQVTIKVDGSTPMPAEDVSGISIDDNGNILITSKNGDYTLTKDVLPGDISINGFFINGKIYEDIDNTGTSARITWSTSNAESCVASSEVIQGSATDLPGWSASTVIGVSSDSLNPVDVTFDEIGEFRLYITCMDANGTQAIKSVTAKVGAINLTFTVTSDPIAPVAGDDVAVTLNWNAVNASSCFGSWTDNPTTDLGASGTDSINVLNIQPGAAYTLTCMNLIDEVASTVTLDVTDPGPDCNVTLESRLLKGWTTSFGSAFPGPNFTRIGFAAVPTTGYTAYTFATGDVQDDGYVATFQANGTSGARLISISEVPGCFDVEPKCLAKDRDTTIEWDTTGSSSTACQLKPDTTYYWNITFTDGVSGSTTRCTSDCYAGLVVNNPDF